VASLSQTPLFEKKTQQTKATNIHALGKVQNCYPCNEAAADLGFRPHDHRDKQWA